MPGSADRLEAAQVFVEAQVEIDPLHLAVGDPIEPRRGPGRRWPAARRPGPPPRDPPDRRGRDGSSTSAMNFSIPARERPAPDHRCGNQGLAMASLPFSAILPPPSLEPESNARAAIAPPEQRSDASSSVPTIASMARDVNRPTGLSDIFAYRFRQIPPDRGSKKIGRGRSDADSLTSPLTPEAVPWTVLSRRG